MKYTEAKELYALASMNAESFFSDKSVQEAMMVMPFDGLLDHNDEAVTEAYGTAMEALKSLATWFKNLFSRFQAVIRSITFKASSKKLKKLESDVGKTAITISKEELDNMKDALSELKTPMESLPEKLTATDLAKICKTALQKGNEINNELKARFTGDQIIRDPQQINIWLKEEKKKANSYAKLVRICLKFINSAIKDEVVESKSKDKEVDTTIKALPAHA
jgi:hypothetical protein